MDSILTEMEFPIQEKKYPQKPDCMRLQNDQAGTLGLKRTSTRTDAHQHIQRGGCLSSVIELLN